MIASGCPVRTKFHAPFIAEMALDMVSSVQEVKDISKDPPESLRIRVGKFYRLFNDKCFSRYAPGIYYSPIFLAYLFSSGHMTVKQSTIKCL